MTITAAFHSMRLFPRNTGAPNSRLSGIAAKCDWVVLSDRHAPKTALVRRTETQNPKTVFLSLRNAQEALTFFADEVLPQINGAFVLVSGSEDVTLPNQIDCRFPPFEAATHEAIRKIVAAPQIIHWFAENLDTVFAPNVSAFPTGMVFPDATALHDLAIPEVAPQSERPLTVLSAHRVRNGPQWDTRQRVTNLAETVWAEFAHSVVDELPEKDFLNLAGHHSFVLCVEGGGLDPSPKAWQALQYGAIPIMRHTAVSGAYRDLPCAYVDRWDQDQLSRERLSAWKALLSPWFDEELRRKEVLQRLTIDHHWNKVLSLLPQASRETRRS